MEKTTVEQVKEFHETFNHPVLKVTDHEPLAIRQLRIKLLFEELKELAVASDCRRTFQDLCINGVEVNIDVIEDGDNPNRVEELDALCDLQYVLDGKKLTSGLHEVFQVGFDLVHKNNMDKAHEDIHHAQETMSKFPGQDFYTELKNGKIILTNSSGKVIKPHDHKKVSLTDLIRK